LTACMSIVWFSLVIIVVPFKNGVNCFGGGFVLVLTVDLLRSIDYSYSDRDRYGLQVLCLNQ
jgi:hypothetical protein